MTRIKITGVVLAAVCAFAALGATGASAKPVWKVCAKGAKVEGKYVGKFTDKLCSKKASEAEITEGKKNKYELVAGIGKGKPFKGSGSTAILHNVIPGKGDIKIECASFKDEGKVAAPSQVVAVTSTFSKCKSLGSPCKSEGGKKETITTTKLAGALGYLNKAHTAVGESLTSESAPNSGYLAMFECEGLAKVRVHGAVIGALEPFGVVTNEAKATFTVGNFLGEPQPGYKPVTNPPSFEEGAEPVGVLLTELNGPETGNEWAPEGGLPSGQEAKATNKGETLEVN